VTVAPPFATPSSQVNVNEVEVLDATTSSRLRGASGLVVITAPLPYSDESESP
jgi:hypothetical protein